jgi:hypothetical protein
MAREPAYFDSQASAASVLNIDIDVLRDAKAAGCPAFRSGRVYKKELQEWLRKNARKKSSVRNADDEIVSAQDWENRRQLLFDLLEFIHSAYIDGRIGLKEYREIGSETVECVIRLGRAWRAGIDEKGYRRNWVRAIADAGQKKIESER